jgi:hypothetical protein
MQPQKYITLKHLMIDGKRMIGLQFYPDKVIQALIKQLPEVKWSKEHQLAYIPNRKDFLSQVYTTFRGVAWLNGKQFYGNSSGKETETVDMKIFRAQNTTKVAYPTAVPDTFIDTLERKHYALNTAKVYISHFSKFINYFPKIEIDKLTDLEVNQYLSHLTKKEASKSYINSSVNAIKFYYEVVLGMPNRFYKVDRSRKDHRLPSVISKKEALKMIEQRILSTNVSLHCYILRV